MKTDNPRMGGWRGHPNSIAALLKYQVRFGSPASRRCTRCGRVAVRGRARCWTHEGLRRRDTPERLASRVLVSLSRRGLVPGELEATALWRDVAAMRSRQRDRLRLALVLAWDRRDSEPLAWAGVWRKAQNAVRDRDTAPA